MKKIILLVLVFQHVNDSQSQSTADNRFDSLKIRETQTVYANFVIDANGKPKAIEIVISCGEPYDSQALEALKKMPDWFPGKVEGRNVSVKYNLPIKFGDEIFEEGVSLYNKSEYEQALKKFKRVLTYSKDAFYAYYNKALCELKIGKNEKACEDLEKATALGDLEAGNLLRVFCNQ